MNWDKFERSKKYFLMPLFVWWGIGILCLLSGGNGIYIGIGLLIGGILITRKHYKKYKKLHLGDSLS